ncbi:MAG: two-component sensor histidine kinase [Chitinivibrionia bacterium]|nr:two-component sensor histidine kinase [Chitinivibrionia bacterium]
MAPHDRGGPAEVRMERPAELHSRTHYRRLWKTMVISTSVVALLPLIILTIISYLQYKKTFRMESINPVHNLTATTKHSLEFFLSERLSALTMVINSTPFERLADGDGLAGTLANLAQAFGGFIDLGLIDAQGKQLSYAGPYNLGGRDYSDQEWFHEVGYRDVHISEVFMGYRKYPHFVIAVKQQLEGSDFYVLRATIASERLNQSIMFTNLDPSSDAFLINKHGVIQSPSRFYGAVFEQCPLSLPPLGTDAQVVEENDEAGRPIILGYAPVERSPFILVLVKRSGALMGNWATLRTELFGFVAFSALLILLVIVYGSTYLARQVRDADAKRADIFHKMEYTNKLAAIGRLGAGVAHEINNPLAIISQKAGLMKDIVTMTEEFPKREKFLDLINSILKSVDRCSNITHRLLGFAKHMDVQTEPIHLELLLKEVFGFLEKEAMHRNLNVSFDIADDLPTILSDRGQLQQVFLNILNNAFAAVPDGGDIGIAIYPNGELYEAVDIKDNGSGISEENLKHIFEPFFTTKKGGGTGLGLSITYGIVEKLGGRIYVESEVGVGTKFTVMLPIKREP